MTCVFILIRRTHPDENGESAVCFSSNFVQRRSYVCETKKKLRKRKSDSNKFWWRLPFPNLGISVQFSEWSLYNSTLWVTSKAGFAFFILTPLFHKMYGQICIVRCDDCLVAHTYFWFMSVAWNNFSPPYTTTLWGCFEFQRVCLNVCFPRVSWLFYLEDYRMVFLYGLTGTYY